MVRSYERRVSFEDATASLGDGPVHRQLVTCFSPDLILKQSKLQFSSTLPPPVVRGCVAIAVEGSDVTAGPAEIAQKKSFLSEAGILQCATMCSGKVKVHKNAQITQTNVHITQTEQITQTAQLHKQTHNKRKNFTTFS